MSSGILFRNSGKKMPLFIKITQASKITIEIITI